MALLAGCDQSPQQPVRTEAPPAPIYVPPPPPPPPTVGALQVRLVLHLSGHADAATLDQIGGIGAVMFLTFADGRKEKFVSDTTAKPGLSQSGDGIDLALDFVPENSGDIASAPLSTLAGAQSAEVRLGGILAGLNARIGTDLKIDGTQLSALSVSANGRVVVNTTPGIAMTVVGDDGTVAADVHRDFGTIREP